MAKAKTEGKTEDDSILKTVAKAVGSAAGTVASLAGVTEVPATHPVRARVARVGKLLPKNKSRLPRKAKKAMQRKAAKA